MAVHKFAPSPWKAHLYVNHWWVIDAYNEDVAVMQGSYQYDAHNAQLIACAPELLRACQLVVDILSKATSNIACSCNLYTETKCVKCVCDDIFIILIGVLSKAIQDPAS